MWGEVGYLELMSRIKLQGDERMDRTGVGTKALFGTMLSFDLQEGFPLLTTKEVIFKSVKAELAGFLMGVTHASDMEALGTKIWNANAKAWDVGTPDYMGRIYGVQWREWNKEIDQLSEAAELLKKNPTSRRMMVTAWNPSELEDMCLPPCHTHFQFFVRKGHYLDCIFYMRSVDTFLGMPFDIASYALLTHIMAKTTGLEPGVVTGMFGDTHLYNNHAEQVDIQLEREPYQLPELVLHPNASIDSFSPYMATVVSYEHHPRIKAEMAV